MAGLVSNILTGTLPLKPYDPGGFVGTVESDGQHPHVAAVACESDGRVICRTSSRTTRP